MSPSRPALGGALAGAAAAAVVVALMFGLRLLAGVLALPDIAADALTLALPGGVFGFLIDRLHHFGRPLLLVGVAGGLVILGAAVGALAARLARQPLALRVPLPALAMSTLTLPAVLIGTLGDDRLLPTAVATFAYWLLYALLLQLGLSGGSVVARGRVGPSRRALLHGAGALGALWLGAFLASRLLAAAAKSRPVALPTPEPATAPPSLEPAGAPTSVPEPFPEMTGITSTKDFYVISKNGLDDPVIDAATWRLVVQGQRSYALTYDELRALASVERPRTLECISNEVGGPLISSAFFRGVPLRDLITRAGMPPSTVEIRFTCADGYTESIDLGLLDDTDTIVAHSMNGEPLTKEHGFPARLLMSGRYGMKNPKWLTRIQTIDRPFNGYWEQRGWSKQAIVLTMSRLDVPHQPTEVPVGRPFAMRGIAYAGSRGIGKVELSFDGGRGWVEARLRRLLAKDNWMPFVYVWTPPAAGTYELVVRATDGDGDLQDPMPRDSFPNGATGYHRVTVKAV